MSQAPSLRSKKKNLRQVNNPQKNVVGDQVAPICKSQEQREEQGKMQLQSYHLNQRARHNTKTLSLKEAKQQWEEEMERLNSKYNLDCYSDSELDSESDEGEQYCYEHGYEMLI